MTLVGELLVPGGHADARSRRGALRRALRERLGRGGRLHVMNVAIDTDDIAAALETLLATPVGNLAIQGYRDHHSVREACRRTAGHPGGREALRLMEHTLSLTHRPMIQAEIGGATVPVVELTLHTELHVSCADITVVDGDIASSEFGSTRGRATLAAGKVVLLERDWEPVDLNDARVED